MPRTSQRPLPSAIGGASGSPWRRPRAGPATGASPRGARAGRGGDMGFAYGVQDRLLPLVAGGSAAPAGYKIGLTTPRMQQMCAIDEPIVGVILAGRIHASLAHVAVGDFVRLGIESEIALRIGTPFPPGGVAPE